MFQLDEGSYIFPAPEYALCEPNGLLAIGGDLAVGRLQAAYYEGIFPFFNPTEIPLWWSPDPRAVLLPAEIHISRTTKKRMRKTPYVITLNHAFEQVIAGCAQRQEGTWITHQIIEAYTALHQLGVAHSVEVWHNTKLIGGLYGVNVGKIFCGESMFSRVSDGSKYALIAFYHHFLGFGGKLFDCQIINAYTASLGVREIPRVQFLNYLYQYRDQPIDKACWLKQTISLPSAEETNHFG